jgi:hypothetical protein
MARAGTDVKICESNVKTSASLKLREKGFMENMNEFSSGEVLSLKIG